MTRQPKALQSLLLLWGQRILIHFLQGMFRLSKHVLTGHPHEFDCSNGTTSHDCIWMSTVAINGHTKILYCEDDCTYTVVYVPRQIRREKIGAYYFQIALNQRSDVSIILYENTTMIFSGLTLTHSQIYMGNDDDCDFINFVSYGNQKLFSHMKKLFERNVNYN